MGELLFESFLVCTSAATTTARQRTIHSPDISSWLQEKNSAFERLTQTTKRYVVLTSVGLKVAVGWESVVTDL